MSKVELKDIHFCYTEDNNKSFQALEGICLQVADGEFVSLIGSSGCGKSTTLRILAGLNIADSGSFTINGKEINGTGKERGVVFQHYSLFPWMTIQRNIEFGIRQNLPELTEEDRNRRAAEVIEEVGLAGFEHKYPSQLSGGMQQRAAIARTLAMKTDILLMDEPFGAIDAKNRVILQDLLLKLLYEAVPKKTIIFVTHDVDEAILLSDRILFMQDRKIAREIKVPFPRPRLREELSGNVDYHEFRRKIINLFYYGDDESLLEVEGGAGI